MEILRNCNIHLLEVCLNFSQKFYFLTDANYLQNSRMFYLHSLHEKLFPVNQVNGPKAEELRKANWPGLINKLDNWQPKVVS